MTDIISWYDRANRPLNPTGRMSFTVRFNSSSYMASLCINFGGELVEVPQNTGVAQWLRHCATSREVPGSNPGGVGHRDFSRGYRQNHVPWGQLSL